MNNRLISYLIKNNNSNNIAEELVKILESKNLLHLLPSVRDRLHRIQNWQDNKSELIVRTPFELSADNKLLVENRFSKKISQIKIDKSLLAGLIANDDKGILDISLKSLLTKLN